MSRSGPDWIRLGVVVAAFAVAGCDSGRIGGVSVEDGNVEVSYGASVETTDTSVIVDGQPMIRYPSNHASMRAERFERFWNGGFPEHDYEQSTGHSVSWRLGLRHGYPPVIKGDSTIFYFVDHGDAEVEGVPLDKLTGPIDPGGHPVRFENNIVYLLSVFSNVDWHAGGSTTFVDLPFAADLLAGRELRLATTGSEEVEPAEALFAVRPFATLTAIENAGPATLHGEVPVIDVGEPLTLQFDHPLDPERGYMLMIPFAPFGTEATRAFIQPRAASERVVIPSDVLRQLRGAGTGPLAFTLFIIEVGIQDDVFTGRFSDYGAGFALPFVQQSESSVHLYLDRS